MVIRDLTLENPIRAIREISHDTTCRRKVRLANGREVSALDIQSEYLSKAIEFTNRRGADSITRRVLELWGRTLSAVENGDLGRSTVNRLGHEVPADRALPGRHDLPCPPRGWP